MLLLPPSLALFSGHAELRASLVQFLDVLTLQELNQVEKLSSSAVLPHQRCAVSRAWRQPAGRGGLGVNLRDGAGFVSEGMEDPTPSYIL